MFSMVVKTITITEDAYVAVKSLKNDDESFSDLFLRLGKQRVTFKDIVGILGPGDIDTDAVKDLRKKMSRDMEAKISHVRARLERHN